MEQARRVAATRDARITRRQFLRQGGLATLGLGIASSMGFQIGCGHRRSGLSGSPPYAAWKELQDSLKGLLLRPGSPRYDQTGLPSNLDYINVRPQGIVLCAGIEDVQVSVKWARKNGLPAVPYSGGHNYAGYSTTTGLLVDLSAMNQIDIDRDNGMATLGPGARLDAIDDKVDSVGLAVSGGRCKPVAIGGLVLGGGIGFGSRSWGLTCDTLLQTQIVGADGEVYTCSDKENPDLFWALRGGGGGNFGINVSYQLRLFQAPTASVFKLEWGDSTKADFGTAWSTMQGIAARAPKEFSMILAAAIDRSQCPGQKGDYLIEAIGQYLGPVEDLQSMLEPALAVPGLSSQTIRQMPFAQATTFLQQVGNPDAFLTKSAYLDRAMPDDGIAKMLDAIQNFPVAARAADFAIFTWGGKISDVAPDATAFANRGGAFLIEGDSSWCPGSPQGVIDESKAWIQKMWVDLGSYFSGAAYQNFIDRTQTHWQKAYYGGNFPRLVRVKAAYDPDNFFNFAQSIPTK